MSPVALASGAAQKDSNVTDKSRMGRLSSDVKQQAGYSPGKLKSDLKRVRTVFDNVAATRDRYAIYKYWHAVYKLRRKWRRLSRNEGVKIKKIAKRAVKGGIPSSSGDGLLRLIIDETTTTNVQSPFAGQEDEQVEIESIYLCCITCTPNELKRVTLRSLSKIMAA
jgi:hypothetical protein